MEHIDSSQPKHPDFLPGSKEGTTRTFVTYSYVCVVTHHRSSTSGYFDVYRPIAVTYLDVSQGSCLYTTDGIQIKTDLDTTTSISCILLV
jgi:hypothetical protein